MTAAKYLGLTGHLGMFDMVHGSDGGLDTGFLPLLSTIVMRSVHHVGAALERIANIENIIMTRWRGDTEDGVFDGGVEADIDYW